MATFQDCKVFFDNVSKNSGVTCAYDEHLPQGTLTVENFDLLFCFLENSGELLLQAGVGLPCDERALPADQVNFWKNLAKANNLFAGATGCALGYDPEADLVTLQMPAPVEGMTQESFEALLQTMLLQCAAWMQRLAESGMNAFEEAAKTPKASKEPDAPHKQRKAAVAVKMA